MKDELDKAVFSYTTGTINNDLEDENKLLRETISQLRTEVERYRMPALLVAEVTEVFLDKTKRNAVIRVPNGNSFFVNISNDVKTLAPNDTVLVEQKNLTIIEKINSNKKFNVEQFVIIDKPKISWKEIGGLDEQIEEIKEVVELPLKKPELFKKVGITPPKGILLHGTPGTGKTLLAKAVAKSTNSTFIEIVGSELVQKFIGEGAKLVKEIFQLAREKSPAIVFIDEIDALAAKRIETGTSGEREVQRTFMQLLAEIDGFKNLGNVKIIGCTNRLDILDPAITRPGRLDRLIEVPNPKADGIKDIFNIHTKNMTLAKAVKVDSLVKKMEGFSGAEIRSVCTEAGYFAIRGGKTSVTEKNFLAAIDKVKNEEEHAEEYKKIFG